MLHHKPDQVNTNISQATCHSAKLEEVIKTKVSQIRQKSFSFLQELQKDYAVFSCYDSTKLIGMWKQPFTMKQSSNNFLLLVTEGYTQSNDTKLTILDFRQWNFSDLALLLLLTSYLKFDAVEWCEFSLLTENWTKC